MNKFTLSYTLYDTSGESLSKPIHKKIEFESESDLLGALDEGGCKIWDGLKETYGEMNNVDVILRSINHDNAQEWYKLITSEGEQNV